MMQVKNIKRRKIERKKIKNKAFVITLDAFLALIIFTSFFLYFYFISSTKEPLNYIKLNDLALISSYRFSNLSYFNSTLSLISNYSDYAYEIYYENGTIISFNTASIPSSNVYANEFVFYTDSDVLGKIKVYFWNAK